MKGLLSTRPTPSSSQKTPTESEFSVHSLSVRLVSIKNHFQVNGTFFVSTYFVMKGPLVGRTAWGLKDRRNKPRCQVICPNLILDTIGRFTKVIVHFSYRLWKLYVLQFFLNHGITISSTWWDKYMHDCLQGVLCTAFISSGKSRQSGPPKL